MATRLGALTVTQAAAGILDNTADLTRYVDAAELAGDDELPDPEKVKAAAEKLATDKPALAKRRIAGDTGQGPAPARRHHRPSPTSPKSSAAPSASRSRRLETARSPRAGLGVVGPSTW